MCGLMPTLKPGQIRCPTCHRPTPPAAFCTQCGAAIPASAQPRPRGMDRDELEERIRTRRPGEGGLRRGTPLDEDERATHAGGYVPFVPEPEDAKAVREEEEPDQPAPNVDNTPSGFDWPREDVEDHQIAEPQPRSEPRADAYVRPEPEVAQPAEEEELYDDAMPDEAPYDDEPYGAPEDAYPYPYQAGGDGRRRGPGVLPILGFIFLCVLALGIGAAMAGILAGGGIGRSTATPSASQSIPATQEPSIGQTSSPPDHASATPEPTDGPITFPDGAQLAIQPCGSSDFEDDAVGRPETDACKEDSSSIEGGEVWAFVVFADTAGSDTLTVQLLENDQVLNEQELTIDDVLDCGSSCNGLIYGAHYAGLFPGDYQLILERDGEFADSATFTVEG